MKRGTQKRKPPQGSETVPAPEIGTPSAAMKEVTWDEAIDYTAGEFKRIQAQYGRESIGGIVSSRCTNEEGYLVQKMIRAAFGNNNTDTCARVCHSPTGYGLSNTFGTSAGTQDFDSVEDADVIMVIGANPTDAHPVFASQMKRRLRAGARLIVVDPRRIDLVKSAHIKADYHLPLRPGTNVAVVNSMAHTIVTEGLAKEDYVWERCDVQEFERWRIVHLRRAQFARSNGAVHGHSRAGASRGGAVVREGTELGDLLRVGRDGA